jgi:hypothetical protein
MHVTVQLDEIGEKDKRALDPRNQGRGRGRWTRRGDSIRGHIPCHSGMGRTGAARVRA